MSSQTRHDGELVITDPALEVDAYSLPTEREQLQALKSGQILKYVPSKMFFSWFMTPPVVLILAGIAVLYWRKGITREGFEQSNPNADYDRLMLSMGRFSLLLIVGGFILLPVAYAVGKFLFDRLYFTINPVTLLSGRVTSYVMIRPQSIILRHPRMLPLEASKDLHADDKGLVGRWLNYGTLRVDSEGIYHFPTLRFVRKYGMVISLVIAARDDSRLAEAEKRKAV